MTPQELKASILQLAIQGKLVDQRPEEGTGAELYRQILAHKKALFGDRKEAKLSNERFKDDEIPFPIPDTWKWVRFGHIMINRDAERIPLSVDERAKLEKKFDYYGASGVIDKVDRYLFDKKLLLIGEDGANLLTRSTPIAFLAQGKYWVNNHAHVLDYSESCLCVEYVMWYINAINLAPYVTGTAQPKMNQQKMNSIPVPLPPLAEQKRIVAKIEELLPLIDRYEKAWGKLEDFNRRFPVDMQKSLLQMAIQGKLVEQRPEEGTGAELLEKILAAKNAGKNLTRRRGERGGGAALSRGKNSAHSAPPREEILDSPFDIPESWVWVRLGNLFDISRGGSPRPIKAFLTTEENGLNWIKIGDTEKNSKYINSCQEKIIPAGLSKTRQVYKGDLLLTNSMSFGRPYILNIDGCIHDGWLVLHPLEAELFKDFFFYLLSSPVVFHQFQVSAAGAVVQNLNSDKVAQTVIPLPPLAEQKRIVAKLEELLPLCERLK